MSYMCGKQNIAMKTANVKYLRSVIKRPTYSSLLYYEYSRYYEWVYRFYEWTSSYYEWADEWTGDYYKWADDSGRRSRQTLLQWTDESYEKNRYYKQISKHYE